MRRCRCWLGLALVGLWLAGCGGGVVSTPPAAGSSPAATGTLAVYPLVLPSGTTCPLLSPLPTATVASTLPEATATPVAYTVQPGDTLLGLAMQYGVPMAAIQLSNRLGETTALRAGQVLLIPSAAEWAGASPFWVVHVVQPGETLSGIAQVYGLDLAALQEANRLEETDLLRVGQELVLPLEAPLVAEAPPTATPLPLAPPASTPAPAVTVAPPPPPPPPPADVAAWPQEVARLINEVRAQHGLPPLAFNATLALAAQAHADDCAARGWCSHTGSDGADIKTRILRAGYVPASWAECWAQSLTPQGAVEMWMNETPPNDPHRRTLLTVWQTEIGVGVARTGWGYYFIADFGRP